MNIEDKSNNSLCEKSMKMVVNIVKLSSFSLAKMSLGVTGPASSVVTKSPASATMANYSLMEANQPLLNQIPDSKKSEELRMRKPPYSVVMQPDDGNGSSYVINHGDNDSVIDGKTSEFIKKFHEKNRFELHAQERLKLSPYKPFPPSRAIK